MGLYVNGEQLTLILTIHNCKLIFLHHLQILIAFLWYVLRGVQLNFDRIIYILSGTVGVNSFTVANNGSGGFGYWQAMGY